MIYCKIEFGAKPKAKKEASEDVVEEYLSSLLHNGQIDDDYYLTWIDNILYSHAFLARSDSNDVKHNSARGNQTLDQLIRYFGSQPQWIIMDDDVSKNYKSWKSAKFLYLHTHAFNRCSPIFNGNDGSHIPPYLIPISEMEREYLFHWSRSYYYHDHIWIDSGELEVPAYKQLADVNSELSSSGRDFCSSIEEATGIPTYYYLMRYWGRKKGEENRLCPSCGEQWRTENDQLKNVKFWDFHFMCHGCRLVSNDASSDDDERHARIGEYKQKR